MNAMYKTIIRSKIAQAGLLFFLIFLSTEINAQLTQNFSSSTFPPSGWSLYNDPSYTPQMTKRSASVNGYSSTAGTGAVYVDFWNAPIGTKDSLITQTLNATLGGDTLIFDHVHATASGWTVHDSMGIYTSTNNGVTWNWLIGLVGDPSNINCQTCLSTMPGNLTYEMLAPNASDWKTKKYALPVNTNRILFVFHSHYGENLFMDNIIVTRNLPMVYSDAVAVQVADTVFQGMTNAAIINAQVLANNSANPLPVTAIYASTSGTTTTSDITKAKLYYSGTSGGFNPSTATLLATVNNPSGNFAFTGFSQTLSGPVSNFWITYDITSSAAIGDVLDATFDSLKVNGQTKVPSIKNPSGSRYIQSYFNYRYCQFGVTYSGSYLIGPSRVTFGSIDNVTGDFDKVTSYSNMINTMYKADSALITVKGGPGNGEQTAVYVDWNNSGSYENPAEEVLYSAGSSIAPTVTTGWIKVPCNATAGYHRMRVVSDWYAAARVDPCSTKQYGEGEEYTIEVLDQPTPIAQFTNVDTFYTNGVVNFTNTSIGIGNTYQWDYQNDGTYDATTKNGSFQYTTNGTKTIKLKLTNTGCNGISKDSTTRTVVIVTPPAAPTVNFISDKNVVSTTDVVTFFDLSSYGPGSWSWTISPTTVGGVAAYYYVNGTTSSSQNPQVQFVGYGKYTVSLTATNVIGSGTATRPYYINCVRSVNMCGTTTTTTDLAGFLYDDGGKNGNYTAVHDCSLLIKPDCASQVSLKFKMFDMSPYQTPGGDWIKVYDGADASGLPLHNAIGWPAGIQNIAGDIQWLPPTLVANSGKMYIQYHTDGAFQNAGFEAEWSTTTTIGTTPPVASFSVPDTIYTGVNNTYTATAVGTGYTFDWDFNNDGIYDGSGPSVTYTYTTAMTTTVKLLVSSCTGQTTLTKNVVILTPTLKPVAIITTAFNNGTPNDVFQLIDASRNGPSSWTWTITPGTFNYVNNTSANSQNPQVKFTQTGNYTVKLVASNAFGSDSVTQSNYLKVYYYCIPNVNTMNADIGISNVSFGSINNTSPQGVTGYTDYSDIGTVTLERGGSYSITIKRTTNQNPINRKVWIDLNGNGNFTDAGETVLQEAGSSTLSYTSSFTVPATATLGVSRLRVGVNAASLPNLGCGANYFGEFEDYRIVISKDLTKPVISLTGGDTVYTEVGRVFTDPGAVATDNVTSPQTYTATYNGFTNATAMPATGTFTISYDATDAEGNMALTKTRWVIVTPDTTRPVIVLNGSDSVSIAVGSTYTDAGATATDFYFGPVTPTMSGLVNTAVVGLYTVTFTATDSHGNAAVPKVRRVYVTDNTAPVITVLGANPFYWDVKRHPFADPGTTVTDNYSTGLKVTSTTFNLDSLGTYTVVYTAVDASGNQAIPKTRTVIVQDTMKPVLTFKTGTDIYLIDVLKFTVVPEPGFTVSDNYYSASQITVSKSGTVDLNKIGNYPVVYTVVDGSGNTSVYTRIYMVVDREKPVITLKGSSIQNVYRWKIYNDSGATVTDNYYSGLTPIVSGQVDVNLAGVYYLTFNVTDGSGNKADEVIRIVNVLERFDGMNGNKQENTFNIYPNPNTGKFTLDVQLNGSVNATVVVTDMLGNKVKELSKDKFATGKYDFNLNDLAAGNYILQLITDKETISRKLTIVKQ
jgi:PKD repeat protein